MAIGTISLAMIHVLKRFNVSPDITCGHSFGELPALHAAGWIDDSTLLTLAAVRGKLMAGAGSTGSDSGSMLAVQAPLTDIDTWIQDRFPDLVLANRNSPSQGVLSGPTPDIDRAMKWCLKHKIRSVKLPVAAAFHSSLVADAAIPFHRFVADQQFTPTQIPVLSNTTGTLYDRDLDRAKSLLGNQLKHPVCFRQNIEAMRDTGVTFFLELGPKTVLTGLTRKILEPGPFTAVSLDGSAGKKPGLLDLAHALCHLAVKGFNVDLTRWEDPVPPPVSKRMRVLLSGANPKPRNKQTFPDSEPMSGPRPESRTSEPDGLCLTGACSVNSVTSQQPEHDPADPQGYDMHSSSSMPDGSLGPADKASLSHSAPFAEKTWIWFTKGWKPCRRCRPRPPGPMKNFSKPRPRPHRPWRP